MAHGLFVTEEIVKVCNAVIVNLIIMKIVDEEVPLWHVQQVSIGGAYKDEPMLSL